MKSIVGKCSNITSTYAKYLVNTLGLTRQQALSISTKLSLRRNNKVIDSKFVANANSVVTLFRNLGFHDTLVRSIVSKEPRLLASKVDKTLNPKIKLLQDQDFSQSHIVRLISRRPDMLMLRMECTTLPAIQVLRQVMGSDGDVVRVVERLSDRYFCNVGIYLLPNVTLLRSCGVPVELIRKHVLYQPGYYVRNTGVFKDIVMRVEKKLGITRGSPVFLYGVNLISGKSDKTIESKCQIFKCFGWTQFDVEKFIMKNASCFTFSDARIRKRLEFLMNDVQLKPAYLTARSGFFTCSLEKRIVPRHKVLLILKGKGLNRKNISLYSAICLSEPCFLWRFVIPFKEVHEVYAKLSGCSKERLTKETAVGLIGKYASCFNGRLLHGVQRLLLYSASTPTSIYASTTYTYENYLVDFLGFSHSQSLSISTKLTQRRKNKVYDSKLIGNANSVVALFQNLGFDKTHIRKIVYKHPHLLASNVDLIVKPKIRFLQDEDFSRSDIVQLISKRPEILRFGLKSTILPGILILKQVMGSVSIIVNTIGRFNKKYFHGIVTCLLPNVALLSSYGVPIELIRKKILDQPGCYVQNPEVFKGILMRVEKKFGITRDLPMFLDGINLVSGMSEESFESKSRIFKSFGWTHSDIKTFISKNGSFFSFSDERCKNKLDFLMNELQLKPSYLITHNCFITCSLEKRIVPRHMIMMILKEKGLLQNSASLYTAIQMSQPCFLKKLVLPFKEVHEAYAKITGCSVEMLTQEGAVSLPYS